MTTFDERHVSYRSLEPGLASRGSRLLAFLLDGMLGGVALLPLALLAEGDAALTFGAATLLYPVLLLALFLGQMAFLTRDGQTIGKKLAGIRIVKVETDENGGFVTNVLLRSAVGWLLGAIPGYTLVDSLFIFRQDRRCIHDLIAGTKVVVA